MTTDPARRLAPVVRLAPAKINLTLAVLGTRADGYHALHSVMVPIDLADRLSVSMAPPGARDSLHVTGLDPGPLADNLVLRAIRAAREAARAAWGRPEPPPGSPHGSTSGSRSRRGWRVARPMPPRRPTPRSRRGA